MELRALVSELWSYFEVGITHPASAPDRVKHEAQIPPELFNRLREAASYKGYPMSKWLSRAPIAVLAAVPFVAMALGVAVLLVRQAQAQETYSVGPASAGQVTTLTTVITGVNGDTCVRLNAAGGRACTQAQACTAANAPGGASCTAAQARNANVRIWPLTQAGREEFVTFALTLPSFDAMVQQQRNENKRAFCVAWLAATTTQRNTACTDIGLSAGCDAGC